MLARSRTLPNTALIAFALAALITSPSGAADKRSMILATTTSVRDSGLLDALLPEFDTALTAIAERLERLASPTGTPAAETAGPSPASFTPSAPHTALQPLHLRLAQLPSRSGGLSARGGGGGGVRMRRCVRLGCHLGAVLEHHNVKSRQLRPLLALNVTGVTPTTT